MADSGKGTDSAALLKDLATRRSHQQGVVRGFITRIRGLMITDTIDDVKACEDQMLKLMAARQLFVTIHVEILKMCESEGVESKDLQDKADLLFRDVQTAYEEAQEWIVNMKEREAKGEFDDEELDQSNVSTNTSGMSSHDVTMISSSPGLNPGDFFRPGSIEPSVISPFVEGERTTHHLDHDDYETMIKERETEVDDMSRQMAEMRMRMDSMQNAQHRVSMLEDQMKKQARDYEHRIRERDLEAQRLNKELMDARAREVETRSTTPRRLPMTPQAPQAANRTAFDQDDLFNITQVISNTNAEMMRQMIDHNDKKSESFYSTMNVPVTPLQKFDGDSTKYYTFMKRFDEVVHSSRKNVASKLNILLEHCEPDVRTQLDCCNYKNAERGYALARSILKQRYGNPYIVSQAWVERLMEYPQLKKAETMSRFAGELASAYETLETLGFLSELECTRSMRLLVSKLPSYVQNRWRRIHREKMETEEPARLKHLLSIIREAAYEMSDPVFGPESMSRVNTSEVKQKSLPLKKKVTMNVGEQEQRPPRSMTRGLGGPGNRIARFPCKVCNDPRHYTYQCYMFKDYTPAERMTFVNEHKLCYLCLNEGHQVSSCDRTYTCQYPGCRVRHNTTLHRALSDTGNVRQSNSAETFEAVELEDNGEDAREEYDDDDEGLPVLFFEETPVYNGSRYYGSFVLPTVPVFVSTAFKCTTSNAMLDSGSTVTMCTPALQKAIGARPMARSIFILQGITGETTIDADVIEFMLQGTATSESYDTFKVIVNPFMSFSQKHAAQLKKYGEWPHLRHLDICPAHHDTTEILLGQDNAHLFKSREYIDVEDSYAPFGVHTPLGWTVFGNLTGKVRRYREVCDVLQEVSTTDASRQDQLLERMWEIDQVPDVTPMSPINRKIVDRWNQEFKLVDGHVHLSLPFKNEPPNLPNNRGPVLAQLNALKKKFEKNPDLHQQYTASMKTNLDRGYTEKAKAVARPGYENFIPQLPVISERRPGKCRIVGNASFVYRNTSLNMALHQGPNLTGDLVEIMVEFRVHPIVITADIEQMYNQVHVPPEQRDALKILWWPGGDYTLEPEEYQMTTQMFGLISSPAAAMHAMREGVQRYGTDMDPETIQTALRNFYVDDLIKSIMNVAIGIRLIVQLREVLSRIGFNLTKFGSNNMEILESIDEAHRAKPYQELEFALSENTTDKTLGSGWGPLKDVFIFLINMAERPETRRGILSTFSSVFDPMGLVGPVILRAKMLIQSICRKTYDWDQELPAEIQSAWAEWKTDLQLLSGYSVPRWINVEVEKIQQYQVHVFADASETGFGAVGYLSVTDEHSGTTTSSLVMSKARVAPMRQVSIPRLELGAAVLAVKLGRIIERGLHIPLKATVFWSDSTITLHCILSQSRTFKTFVANRVAYIQERTTSDQWRFVNGDRNIADVASRGCCVTDLRENKEWQTGPTFLKDEALWPPMPDVFDEKKLDSTPEYKTTSTNTIYVQTCYGTVPNRGNLVDELIDHYSSWRPLVKAVSYWRRFIQYLRDKKKAKGLISSGEYRDAEEVIFRRAQHEFHSLDRKRDAVFKKLYTFDSEGLIRVGGRLMMSSMEYEEKYPLVLPPGRVAKLYVRHVHAKIGHPGVDRTYMETRRRVWIISGKRFIKGQLSRCVMCQRLREQAAEQHMAPLPKHRVDPSSAPFKRVGIDFFGPVHVKVGRATVKRYGCAISCLTSRAMHIEPVTDLSTSAFLQALQRFIARRGSPDLIVSDNGTNFVGAHRELREMLKKWNRSEINDYLIERGVEWRFNTPAASHHGGVWERQIRSIRTLMMALIKNETLSDEAFHTYLCAVEQIINSRPLTKMSEDPSDEIPLTPQHFLTMHQAAGIPGVYGPADALRRRWKQVQHLSGQYWTKWMTSYLKDLQVRTKWNVPHDNFRVGDLALFMKQDCKRMDWPLALITKVHKGIDGKVRSVTIKTKDGVYDRPIVKLIRLEFDE